MSEKKTDLFEAGLLRSKLILSEYESKFKMASLLYETHKDGEKLIGGLDGLEEVISCKGPEPLEKTFRNYTFSICPGESTLRTANGYFIVTFYRNKTGVSYIFKLSQQNRAGLEAGVASFSIIDEGTQKLIYANTEKALHGEIKGLGNENINFAKEIKLKGAIIGIGINFAIFGSMPAEIKALSSKVLRLQKQTKLIKYFKLTFV